MQLEVGPAWFRWRRAETVYGFVRAELTPQASADAAKEQETWPAWVLGEGEGEHVVASLRLASRGWSRGGPRA